MCSARQGTYLRFWDGEFPGSSGAAAAGTSIAVCFLDIPLALRQSGCLPRARFDISGLWLRGQYAHVEGRGRIC